MHVCAHVCVYVHAYKLWMARAVGEWPHKLQLPAQMERQCQAKAIATRSPQHDTDRWFDRETAERRGERERESRGMRRVKKRKTGRRKHKRVGVAHVISEKLRR